MIRHVPGGICTTWVFEHLKEKQRVYFSGPYGQFRLTDSDVPVLFVAGGSGMAPIWSILQDMRERGNTRRATYFFGALTQKDLFLAEELKRLQDECEWFTYVPALSRDPDGSGWEGERGLITDVVARHVPDCSAHEAYLCGSPGLIDASVKVLTSHGMKQERIFYDKFA
jgi:Na+-transporting NADH:ubiquinone oxidoreductase subunit F